jgi:serine protease Do
MTPRFKTLGTVLVAVPILFLGSLLGAWAIGKNKEPVVFSSSASAPVSFQTGFETAVQKILPAVVNISSSKVLKSPLFSDPLFKQFFENNFGEQAPRELHQQSLGSGVIVRPDGYILTNSHVVEGADSVTISRSDGREFDAKVVGLDKKSDLAVLKINAKGLPVANFGGPDRVGVGDFALAVGNPFGVGQTVTMGIISATGRGGLGVDDVEDFIQTDAAINPGNSGGALVNVNGNLIGINTAILTGGAGGSQGVGFAIPVTLARNVMDQIISSGKVVRGWLGVAIQPVTPAIAKSFHLPGEPRGGLIADVAPQSPAAKAGLRKGDIVLELNGAGVSEARQLSLKISQMSPGSTVRLKIFRDNKETEQSVVLGEHTAAEADKPAAKPASSRTDDAPRLGISAVPLTGLIRQRLHLPATAIGIAVADVEPGSTAAEAGLQNGDVIEELNRKPAQRVDALQEAVRSSGGEPILLLIARGDTHFFVTIHAR